jgi:hypothetical protein
METTKAKKVVAFLLKRILKRFSFLPKLYSGSNMEMAKAEMLRTRHHSSSAFTDQEYAEWYKSIVPALIEFSKWRQKHQGF